MSWIRVEATAIWIAFTATFLAVAIWESWRPLRGLSAAAERRWTVHGILLVVSLAASALFLRISPVALALLVAGRGFGLMNLAPMPLALRCAAAILLLDLVHYATHRTFHRVSLLWRVHEVHHSDPDFDVSTAARFHPLEALGTQAVYLVCVALLAPPAIALLLAEVLSSVANLVAHANAAFPPWLDDLARLVFVTPAMHRIHHSQEIEEQSRNFGQTFAFWDRLFGTYLARPRAGESKMVTGVAGFQTPASLGLAFMLAEPFHPRPEQPGNLPG